MSHLNFDPSHEIAVKDAMTLWRSMPDLYRLDSPILMKGRSITPGSKWTDAHIFWFHMIPVLDLDIQHVLPMEHIQTDMDKFEILWKLNRADIYHHNTEKLFPLKNPQVYETSACILELMKLVERRKSSDSDSSSTSDEGETLEVSSAAFASSLCNVFLDVLGLHHKYPPSWDYVNKAAYNIKILHGITGKVRADGVILFAESRHDKQAAVWIEVKRLKFSPRNKSNYLTTLPQKAAEALAVAQSRDHQYTKDQEVFGIEFSHRFVSFWHAIFPANYLSSLESHTSLPPEQYVVLKRSKTLDLIEASDRFQFAQNMVGMMNYLTSGNAKIGNWS